MDASALVRPPALQRRTVSSLHSYAVLERSASPMSLGVRATTCGPWGAYHYQPGLVSVQVVKTWITPQHATAERLQLSPRRDPSFAKTAVLANAPAPGGPSTSCALAMAASHPLAEKPGAWGVFEATPALESTRLDSPTSPMVSLPPPGWLGGYLACEARSAPTAPTGSNGWRRTRLTSTTNTEPPTMTKAEMIQRIAQELGCTTAQAAQAVEAILSHDQGQRTAGGPRHPAPLWHVAGAR